MMTRTRKIENSPQNGGKHCPSLVQKRGCQGYKCHSHSDRRALRGKLLYYKYKIFFYFLFILTDIDINIPILIIKNCITFTYNICFIKSYYIHI